MRGVRELIRNASSITAALIIVLQELWLILMALEARVAWEIVYVCGRRVRQSLLSRWFTRLWASQVFPRSELPCVLQLTLCVHRHVGNTPKPSRKDKLYWACLKNVHPVCIVYDCFQCTIIKQPFEDLGSVIFVMFSTKKNTQAHQGCIIYLNILKIS